MQSNTFFLRNIVYLTAISASLGFYFEKEATLDNMHASL